VDLLLLGDGLPEPDEEVDREQAASTTSVRRSEDVTILGDAMPGSFVGAIGYGLWAMGYSARGISS
jgi:hypothetical protein